MAIALRATGTWSGSGNPGVVPVIPAGGQAGDLMVMFFGSKPFNNTPSINQNWNDGGFATNGTTNAGTDTGSMQAKIFWKIHTGSESNPTITNSGTISVSSAVIVIFSKDPARFWDLQFGGGGDASAGTGFSATTTNTISLAANDWVASFIATNSDAGTIGTFTTTASGMTFGAFQSQPTANFATTSGGDMCARSGYNTVTAGTATTAITVASTLGGSFTGSMYLVRMRESLTAPVATSFDPMGRMGFFGL